MIVKKSSDAGEGKNAMIADALTLGEKCLSTARDSGKNILTAQAGALMAKIQLQELEPLEDSEKEKERLNKAKAYQNIFGESVKAMNEDDKEEGEPTD